MAHLLRDGVRFHDGSAFDADAVIWNFEKMLNLQANLVDDAQPPHWFQDLTTLSCPLA
jgi:ABC-type transport system substrate-binding protein